MTWKQVVIVELGFFVIAGHRPGNLCEPVIIGLAPIISFMYFQHCEQILANKTNSVLYIGVTNNLERRIYEHKNKLRPGFTEKYNVSKLVWYEECSDVKAAIQREKNLKKWKRSWKNTLIEKENPDYKNLSSNWE